jgi:hypothetical protein
MNEAMPDGRCIMPVAKWKKLGKDIDIVKLWEIIDLEWPQVAVLLLSKDEYKKYLKNPKDYLNGFKVFGETPTREVTLCHPASEKSGNPAQFVVIVSHDKDCTGTGISSSSVKL